MLILLDPIQVSLQWGLSILSLTQFFPLHDYTNECNNAKSYPNFDLYLSILSSIVAFYLIIPSVYVLARMITPTMDTKRLKTMRNDYFKENKSKDITKVNKQPWLLVLLKYVPSLFAFDIMISYGISHWLRQFAKSITITRDNNNRNHLLHIQDKLNDSSRRFYSITGQTEEENRRWQDSKAEKIPDYMDLWKQEFFEAYHYKLILLEIDDDDDETRMSLALASCYKRGGVDILRLIVYIITLIEILLCIGHFSTLIGRECWRCIGIAYQDWLLCLIGYWDSHGFLCRLFKIERTIDELSIRTFVVEDNQTVSSSSSYSNNDFSLDELKLNVINPLAKRVKGKRQKTVVVATKNEVPEYEIKNKISRRYKQFYSSITLDNTENDYTSVIVSKLGTKAILLQLIPVLNIASLFLVATVGSPLFVYDDYLLSKLPCFIPFPTRIWKELVEDEMRTNRMTEDELYHYYQYRWR